MPSAWEQKLDAIRKIKQHLRERNAGLRQLKKKCEDAVKDDEQAAKIYGDLINLAQHVSYLSGEMQVRSIREQELNHTETYRELIREIDVIIAENEKVATRIEEEQHRGLELVIAQALDPDFYESTYPNIVEKINKKQKMEKKTVTAKS